MVDVVDQETRSRMMSGIKGKDTKPELIIRKALFRQGFRYTLHNKSLPGKPDLALKKYKAVIFINGCFWHGHDCRLFKWPQTRKEFWRDKIQGNRKRDLQVRQDLREQGWRVLTIWECATKGKEKVPLDDIILRAVRWLRSDNEESEIRGSPTKA